MTTSHSEGCRVYVVQHVHDAGDGSDDVKFIGVYSSKGKANRAVVRLGKQPGFSSARESFFIDEYVLDKDNWTEGFSTV